MEKPKNTISIKMDKPVSVMDKDGKVIGEARVEENVVIGKVDTWKVSKPRRIHGKDDRDSK